HNMLIGKSSAPPAKATSRVSRADKPDHGLDWQSNNNDLLMPAPENVRPAHLPVSPHAAVPSQTTQYPATDYWLADHNAALRQHPPDHDAVQRQYRPQHPADILELNSATAGSDYSRPEL